MSRPCPTCDGSGVRPGICGACLTRVACYGGEEPEPCTQCYAVGEPCEACRGDGAASDCHCGAPAAHWFCPSTPDKCGGCEVSCGSCAHRGDYVTGCEACEYEGRERPATCTLAQGGGA